MQDFVQAVKNRMDEDGLSISEVARVSGVSRPFLSRILSGLAPHPSMDTCARIANAVGLEIDFREKMASRA